jgi:hypothetical protein
VDASFRFPRRSALRNVAPVAPLPPFRWRGAKARVIGKSGRS